MTGANNVIKVAIVSTHPIQYYVPLYQALTKSPEIDLRVYYCHRQSADDHAKSGFGVPFDWNVPLHDGYAYSYLENVSSGPGVGDFFGCDTPGIKKIIKDSGFDAVIVEGWFVKSFWQAITACWSSATRVLVKSDSQLPANGYRHIKSFVKYPLYRWFIPKFDACLSVGSRSKEYFLHYGAEEDRIFLVPHCVDNDFFASSREGSLGDRASLRKKLGLPEKAIVFLLVCKLIPRKRPLDFIHAVRKASEINPDVCGLVVGDGIMRPGLEETVEGLGLPVSFTGFLNQREVPMAYAASDCIVMTSDAKETWGLVVNEAMASSLPAVLSDSVGSSADLIIENETGSVFECGDVDALARIMSSFASRPGDLKRMGQNARNLIDNYSVKRSSEALLNAIRDTAAR